MPRQQTSMKQQVQEAVKQADQKVQQAGEQAATEANNVAQSACKKAAELQEAATSATSNLQDAAKKGVETAQGYIEDARKKADPYVETVRAKYESVKAAAGNARETAQYAVENAKGQVNAVREKVAGKAQPYMDNVQSFDITKTATFHVLTHLISIVLYVLWRVLQLVPAAQNILKVLQEKEKDAGVVDSCAALTQKVPVVGARTVEVVSVAVKSIRTDLNEQIAQYRSNNKKQK